MDKKESDSVNVTCVQSPTSQRLNELILPRLPYVHLLDKEIQSFDN